MTTPRDSLLRHLMPLQRFAVSPRFVFWVNILLILMLAYTLAGISWRFWPQPQQQEISFSSSLPLTQASGELSNLDQVAQLHLFGEVVRSSATTTPQVVNAPETRLSLTLKGILATSTQGEGRALIAAGSGEDKVYKVGESVSGGAVLHEVLVDKVILERDGRFETLTLPRDRMELDTDRAGQPEMGRLSPSRPPTRASGGGAMSRQLSAFRDRVAADPQQALNLMQVQPVVENGAIKGYRVSPGRQRRLFHGTGLRAGDVVTSVNGIAVSDPAKMAELYAMLKSANRLDVMVERGGRPTSLTIDFGK